jgi:dTDP-4-amino-4,6-dideoxygalactose transaminase
MSEREFIPYHRPSIGQAEIDAVTATLRGGWLTTGPRTAQFESEFKEYVGAPRAQAVNSCTAGLHLALAALDVGAGHEVITTPLTFCATVNAILHTGATPVLADILPDGNIDPESVRARTTERTRAIVPVHYAGLPCDMDAIWAHAREHGLHVVEDAAHAIGARYKGHPIGAGNPSTGAASDAVAFSFYATKNLTTGEGGMVTCHQPALAERMRRLCLHGISEDAWNRYTQKGRWYYEVVECGFKYNLSDIQSAIGIEQLRQQEHFLSLRHAYAEYFKSQFQDLAEVETPSTTDGCRHAWQLYALRLRLDRLSISRANFIEELRRRGIGASVHFIPIYEHPYFARYSEDAREACPKAREICPRLVSLPLYPALSIEQVEQIASTVKTLICEHARARVYSLAG